MKFINANGHIVIDINGNYYIVDTGAPTSFNFDSNFEETVYLGGKEYPLQENSYGITASEEIEKLVGKQVYLELFVKTIKNWKDKDKYLSELGFTDFE